MVIHIRTAAHYTQTYKEKGRDELPDSIHVFKYGNAVLYHRTRARLNAVIDRWRTALSDTLFQSGTTRFVRNRALNSSLQ